MNSEDHKPENETPSDVYGEHDPLAPEPLTEEANNVEQLNTGEENNESTEAPQTEANAEIAALQEQLATTKDQMMRVAADAENTKRRALKEKEDAAKYANSKFAQGLLSVADNLRRALDAIPAELRENEQVQNLVNGIEATEREMLKTFEANGIKKIDPTDELFNPNFHEVMFETPGTGKPGGTVIEVLEMGYILHDRLIRPARVGVAKEEGEPGGTLDQQV